MGETEEAIQLINEEKEFNSSTLQYFQKCVKERDVGVDYHVISVFGSQSSGKSTLLNALFHTQFDTMNAKVKRQQTTKGIWLGHTTRIATLENSLTPVKDLFVLDVEGSDGAERGEDQDFERKAALFAIAISEVLIVNMWEQQVGLYQGNNMALLKTVFEVNLSLFGHQNDHKVLLLFVIRDHVGVTPLSSLQETLEAELNTIWSDLAKPEGCENSSLYDFFDLKFTALAHKVLQPDLFMENVKELGNKFSSETPGKSFFKSEYHHNLPLDGWTMYAGNCWNQIETNKDLDLPTQQILVAKFKTEEISNQALALLLENYPVDLHCRELSDLAGKLQELKSLCLQEYDTYASRYAKPVYMDNRRDLSHKIENKFKETISKFLDVQKEDLLSQVEKDLTERSRSTPFVTKMKEARKKAFDAFEELLFQFTKLELVASLSDENESFSIALDEACSNQSRKQLKQSVNRISKSVSSGIKEDIFFLLAHPELDLWDKVMEKFNEIVSDSTERYAVDDEKFDFQVGLSEEENQKVYKKVRSNAWTNLYEFAHGYLNEDNVVSILRDRFENKFRYDEHDSPRLWRNEEEIDNAFRVAKEHALEVLNVLSLASNSDHVEIVPDVPLSSGLDDEELEGEYEDEEGIYHEKGFAHILTASQRERAVQKFKRQANTTVIEAKRSIIRTTTHIPLYVYALLVVLGWNEFMIVIRNPLFVTLLVILSVTAYFVHKLNLWAPILALVNSAVSETKALARNKLKVILDDDSSSSSKASKEPTEEYEMQDLAKSSTTGTD